MPAGALGRQQLQTELRALQRFADRVREATSARTLPPHSAALAIAIDGETWTLQAAIADLRPTGLLRWRYGDSRAGDYLQAWLNHLLLCATVPEGAQTQTRWLSADGEFGFSGCDAPLQRLRELLQLYRRGLCQPLHFYPRTAWQWLLHGRGKALAAWRSGLERAWGEGEDPAYALALRGLAQALDAEFEALAAAVFGPLRRHLHDPRLTS
jgi:exodeoxyribonuclease V gamma subunit